MTDSRKLIATIITNSQTENYGILLPEITGVGQAVQACKVDVSEAGQGVVHHLVVYAHYPALELAFCERLEAKLRNYFGDIIVSFTMTNEEGEADVFAPAIRNGHGTLLSVAAAVAVVKRSWGWDESRWIEIRSESTKEAIKISPKYEDGNWQIEIHP